MEISLNHQETHILLNSLHQAYTYQYEFGTSGEVRDHNSLNVIYDQMKLLHIFMVKVGEEIKKDEGMINDAVDSLVSLDGRWELMLQGVEKRIKLLELADIIGAKYNV